ncbi:hypothetical protein E2C01_028661 [Portunus trituberculatus]|uniref:Uncharacterized protein n=1 Tax=Portunus trituberculatus TaxID=210409 RepID=A0A5B7EQL1_PORTR|nr:hypothetical protein [Portunus trituberculatus]
MEARTRGLPPLQLFLQRRSLAISGARRPDRREKDYTRDGEIHVSRSIACGCGAWSGTGGHPAPRGKTRAGVPWGI